jgi:hypothetical protein
VGRACNPSYALLSSVTEARGLSRRVRYWIGSVQIKTDFASGRAARAL